MTSRQQDEAFNGLSEHLSEAELVALAEAFGGTRLYVPMKLKSDHQLVNVLGLDAARRLLDTLGAGQIRVPMARDMRARHYRALGMSVRQIARRLGMGEVGVSRLLKRIGANDRCADEHKRNSEPLP